MADAHALRRHVLAQSDELGKPLVLAGVHNVGDLENGRANTREANLAGVPATFRFREEQGLWKTGVAESKVFWPEGQHQALFFVQTWGTGEVMAHGSTRNRPRPCERTHTQ